MCRTIALSRVRQLSKVLQRKLQYGLQQCGINAECSRIQQLDPGISRLPGSAKREASRGLHIFRVRVRRIDWHCPRYPGSITVGQNVCIWHLLARFTLNPQATTGFAGVSPLHGCEGYLSQTGCNDSGNGTAGTAGAAPQSPALAG